MPIETKRLSNFIIYGFGQAFNLLGPFIIIPHVVAKCTERGFGKIGLGVSLAFFLILVVDYGFDITSVKQTSENRHNREKLQQLLNEVFQTKIVLCIIALAIGSITINIIPFFNVEKTLFYLSFSIVAAQCFSPVWFLMGVEDIKVVTLINILSKVFYVAGVFVFVNNFNDYIYVNLCWGCGAFLSYVTGIIIILVKYGFRFKIVQANEIKAILVRDFSICISQLFISLRQLSPVIVTGYFLGYFAAGQYKIIENIVMLFRTFLQVYNRYFYASLCYDIYNNTKKGIRFWASYSIPAVLFIFGCVIVIAIQSEIVLLFFKALPNTIRQLSEVLHFALIIPVLMAVAIPLEQLMLSFEIRKVYVRITIFASIFNVVLMILLVNKYNLLGLIAGIITTESIIIALFLVYTKSRLKHAE